MDQSSAPVTENIVRAKIRNRKWKVEHERAAKMYGERRKPKEIEKSWPANTRRLYARIRSDHAKELRCYQKKIDMVTRASAYTVTWTRRRQWITYCADALS